MGTNVRIRKYPKCEDAITAEVILERDIKSCMRCRFFHNSRQCIANKCEISRKSKASREKQGKSVL